eukprot:145678_1
MNYWRCIRSIKLKLKTMDQSVKEMKILCKYGIMSSVPLNPAYIYFVYHITKNEDLCLANKRYLYHFCQKYSIPTIKCFMSIEQLEKYKSNHENKEEFIVKSDKHGHGTGMFATKNPEKYLSQIQFIVIQPRLRNHQQIINVTGNSNTLCTYRVITYAKDTYLKPEAWLSVAMDKNCLTDHMVSVCYIYDIESGLYIKRIDSEFPMIVVSENDIDVHEFKIDGLKEFILYLNDIHYKYLNDLIALGWDIAKITNGDWIIVECNANAGYYYSNVSYAQKIFQTYKRRIAQFSRNM